MCSMEYYQYNLKVCAIKDVVFIRKGIVFEIHYKNRKARKNCVPLDILSIHYYYYIFRLKIFNTVVCLLQGRCTVGVSFSMLSLFVADTSEISVSV